ncbi:TOMM precursor leader peptide-binding protein [uncultured Leifsonia sp.]|uniref:TOMM precursor leader peptide-binding protein n=1 Tax=uncultured Leifsonia sp. TaxID=340359 RepID=UPI0028D0B0DF|nr:TOMM precursor leader peptide-binding protein [uncultured Leifsonia sp.]
MAQRQPRSRFIVNPSLTVIRSSDDEIIVRFGSRSTFSRRLKDDQRNGILGNLVEHFAVGANVDAFLKGDVSPEVVHTVISSLVQEKVLIPESDAAASAVALGLGLADETAIAASTIAVVGDGSIAARLSTQLRASGPAVEASPALTPEAFETADLVVVAADAPDIGLFFDANEAALSLDRPWQSVYVDGAECVIGPLFYPGHTGCFHDFDIMDESARSLRLDYLYYKGATMKAGRNLPDFVADLAASYATASVLQHLGGKGSFLEGFVLRVDLERLEIIRDQLIQLPRCPACIQKRPYLRHPFI